MPRAFCYTRTSPLERNHGEHPPEAQEAACRDAFDRLLAGRGFAWAGAHHDEAHNRVQWSSRPAALRLLRDVEPGDAILFAAAGRGFSTARRLARGVRWLATAREASAHFCDLGVTLGPLDPTAATLLEVFARFADMDKAMRAEQIREAHRGKGRRAGVYTVAPFGYRKTGRGGHIYPHPKERLIGTRILDLRNEGWEWVRISRLLRQERVEYRGKRLNSHKIAWIAEQEQNLREKEASQQPVKESVDARPDDRGV